MIVYVVMGNDYPAAVFANEQGAQQYCVEKVRAEAERQRYASATRIHWRYYDFVLQAEPRDPTDPLQRAQE